MPTARSASLPGATSGTAGTGLAGTLGLSATSKAVATGAVQAGISAIPSQATVSFIHGR